MALPIQLISTDFDGTLHDEFSTPPIPRALEELISDLQAQGAKWVINTGRDYQSLMEVFGRSGCRVRPDFLVVVEREIHVQDNQRFVSHRHWNDQCMQDHEEIFARVRGHMPRILNWIESRFKAQVYEDPYSPFCLIAQNNSDADAIVQYVDDFCREIPGLTVVRNDIYARFSHMKYNKGSALGEVARTLGISSDHIFAAGDHFNDLPMLDRQWARWLTAPQNAIGEVKDWVQKQGGYLSEHRCGHGVAAGLEHFLSAARLEKLCESPEKLG